MLSVIIPVYNVEQYIKRCIESVISQSFTDLEIILVDDGSTDKSGDICDAYASKDSRIKVIHKKNGGLSSARNAGLDIAVGEFVAFVDSDDYIHLRMYELLYIIQKQTGADIVACDMQIIGEQEIPKIVECESFNKYEYVGEEKYSQLWERDTVTVVQWQKLFKKHIFDNLRFQEGRIHEDVYMIHHELFRCEKYVYVDLPLYYYVQHNRSIMHSESFSSINDAIEGYEDRIRFFNTQGYEEYRNKTFKTLNEYIKWRYEIMWKDHDYNGCSLLQKKANVLIKQYDLKKILTHSEIYTIKHMKINRLISFLIK